MDYLVGNVAQLNAALGAAQKGDTINMLSGDYGSVSMKSNAGGVVIQSADADDPARFNHIDIGGASGVTVKNITINLQANGVGVDVTGSSNVHLVGLDIHGTWGTDGGTAGKAVNINSSKNVTVEKSELHDLTYGVSHLNSEGIVISDNYIHKISIDGIRGGGSSNVEISGNYLTDFHRLGGAHVDAIQFWTTNVTTVTHDITVSDNVFVRGTGGQIQGVFMNDESLAGYQNVKITGNQIIGGMYNGIAIAGGHDVVISGNTVVGYKDMDSWIMAKNSTHVTLTDNVASRFTTPNATLDTVSGNKTVALTNVGDLSYLKTSIQDLVNSHETLLAKTAAATGGADALTAHVFTGAGGADTITGSDGADVIDGGGGYDVMIGGKGDDIYVAGHTTDQVIEKADEGIDIVRCSWGRYTLSSNVENLDFVGSQKAQWGTGNGLDNVMEANTLSTTSTTLQGGAGDDTLIVHSGAATLTGGLGADTFVFANAPKVATVITDFELGDKLDLSALFSPANNADPLASGWVKVEVSTTGANVLVDLDGPNGSGDWITLATLKGPAAATPDFVF